MSKHLLGVLAEKELLGYGAVIPSQLVRDVLGLEFPEVGTKAEFDRLSLLELGAVDYVRSHLLNEGKYLTGVPAGYRILLPSENVAQVGRYMSNADGKLRRALKLLRNTPKEFRGAADQTEARIHMKRGSARHVSR